MYRELELELELLGRGIGGLGGLNPPTFVE